MGAKPAQAHEVRIGNFSVGPGSPLLLIAGPCVIESSDILRETASELKSVCSRLGVNLAFKSSFDKANRSSLSSFRGPGMEKGLAALDEIKREFGIPVLSDIHEKDQARPAAEVLDYIQIPAFLARQTDLLVAAARTGKPVNVKKAQFMAAADMGYAVQKMEGQPGFAGLTLCERGASYGYHNLVVDMRSLVVLRSFGWPVVFDATHSVQLPAASSGKSGGERRFIPALARAASAVGVDGIFLETHPRPSEALCDAPNQWPLAKVESLVKTLLAIRAAADREDDNDDEQP
ncbi:MAG: 3-deoxy-8-phosphooctulonate synthase [Deltaproteobacteria bacterium]|jgi:2-dehydro-3-deoxyphosphooctonate aldolase (KDO 8-P synthase)|nr:3-deoxy-8-phosphooctulonate synthase [Deltaproteobacteria bacterium]